MKRDSVSDERGFYQRRGVAILADQDLVRSLEQCDPAPQAREGLRELTADRASADDREARGRRGQREHGLVGEVTDRGEAGDGRGGGARSGGDRGFAKAQFASPHGDAVGSRKHRLAQKHVDAELALVAGGRVVGTDASSHLAHALPGRSEIRARVAAGELQTERSRGARFGDAPARGDDRLRGHAADVEAIPPQRVALDERDLGPQAGGDGCGDQAGRPGADHDEVVPRGGFWVAPIRGKDVGQEALVGLVPGLESARGMRIGHRGASSGRGASSRCVASRSARRATRVTHAVTARVATRPSPSTA